MRNITFDSVDAFVENRNFKKQNMEVNNGKLFLHGNKIAEKSNGKLFITCAGWATNTTKERLNEVLRRHKLGYIYQKNWNWYFVSSKDASTIEFPNAGLTFNL